MNKVDERDFPTIKQIIGKGDSLGDVPMDEEEAQEWFAQTCERNKLVRLRKGAARNGKQEA